MFLTTIHAYLFLIASAVIPISALSVLVQRQSIDNPTCAANCTQIIFSVESCGTPSCLCNNVTAAQVLDCVNCNVQKVATPQDIIDDTNALSTYGTRCAAAGMPLIPLTIDAGASQSSTSGLGAASSTRSSTSTESTALSLPASTSSGAGSTASGTALPSSSTSLAPSAPSSESTTVSPASTSGPSSSQTTSPGTPTLLTTTASAPSTTAPGTNGGRQGVMRTTLLVYVGIFLFAGAVSL